MQTKKSKITNFSVQSSYRWSSYLVDDCFQLIRHKYQIVFYSQEHIRQPKEKFVHCYH